MITNAADPKQIEKARIRESFDDRAFATDMRELLSLPAGRRIFWWLLEICGVFRSSFTGNYTTFFNEGRREVGLQALAKINEAKPEALILMMQESKKREETNVNTP
jgi:hypothetical protein